MCCLLWMIRVCRGIKLYNKCFVSVQIHAHWSGCCSFVIGYTPVVFIQMGFSAFLMFSQCKWSSLCHEVLYNYLIRSISCVKVQICTGLYRRTLTWESRTYTGETGNTFLYYYHQRYLLASFPVTKSTFRLLFLFWGKKNSYAFYGTSEQKQNPEEMRLYFILMCV